MPLTMNSLTNSHALIDPDTDHDLPRLEELALAENQMVNETGINALGSQSAEGTMLLNSNTVVEEFFHSSSEGCEDNGGTDSNILTLEKSEGHGPVEEFGTQSPVRKEVSLKCYSNWRPKLLFCTPSCSLKSLSFHKGNGSNLVSRHIFCRYLDIQNFSSLSLVLSKLLYF